LGFEWGVDWGSNGAWIEWHLQSDVKLECSRKGRDVLDRVEARVAVLTPPRVPLVPALLQREAELALKRIRPGIPFGVLGVLGLEKKPCWPPADAAAQPRAKRDAVGRARVVVEFVLHAVYGVVSVADLDLQWDWG